MKIKLFSLMSFKVWLKLFAVMLITAIVVWFGKFIIAELPVGGMLLAFALFVFSIFLSGYVARRLWGWK